MKAMKEANKVEYTNVKAHGIEYKLGSVSTDDMLQWVDEREDPAKRRVSGIRLLVKSLVDDETGDRVPEAEYEDWVKTFAKKDNRENGRLIAAVLKLNGYDRAAMETEKNASSEAQTGASPTA